jgi:hypothetical protein
MTQYVLVANGWRRPLKWTENAPREMLDWVDYNQGDVIELDPENSQDKLDIQRLANVAFRPALVEKQAFDARNKAQEKAQAALAAARAATLTQPGSEVTSEPSFPEGARTTGAPTTVGAGGTDPEPQGFTGEAGQASWDDEEAWSYPELQQAARARGLSAGGSRRDLVVRLQEFDEANAAPLSKAAVNDELDDDNKDTALNS